MIDKYTLYKEISAYLFEKLNTKAREKGMIEIASIENGMTASLSSASAMPCMLLAIPSRNLIDHYFTRYTINLGIAFDSPDITVAEDVGSKWEDILEETLTEDCHLGGAVVNIIPGITIDGIPLSGLYVVYCEFEADVQR